MRILAFPKEANKSNPYTALLYGGIERQGVTVEEFDAETCAGQNPDIFHVHWPEQFLGRRNPIIVYRNYLRWMRCIAKLSAGGARIVWTAHNIHTHERRHEWLQSRFWREFAQYLDGCICLSEESKRIVEQRFPLTSFPIAVVPHGHYRDAYPNTISRTEARNTLDVPEDSFVIVHVGLIRTYKNVPELARVFRDTAGELLLLIAGEPITETLRKEVEESISGDERIKVELRRVADEDLQNYFKAADLAVFPYKNILNSGSALMALSFDAPVMVPGVGSMPELKRTIGEEWVFTYQGDLTSAALQDAISWVKDTAREKTAPLDELDWDVLAKKTVDFYESLL